MSNAVPLQQYSHSAPTNTATYNSNDPALRKDVNQLKLINTLTHIFAWLFLIGSIIFLVGNAIATKGFARNYNSSRNGFILFITGSVLMSLASLIAWFGHLIDLGRSIRKHIFAFMLVLSVLTSTCFFAGFALLAIGGGLLLRAIRRARYDNFANFNFGSYDRATRDTSAGLVLCTIGAGVATFGIVTSLLLHQLGSIRRVRRHPPRPYTVSHYRNWLAFGGNIEFLIAFAIFDVGVLSAVINQNQSYIRQWNIIGIVSGAWFIMGALRAIYTTLPGGTLYSDAFASPTIPADKVLVAPGQYNANVHAVTSTGVSLPVVSETGLPVGVAPAPQAYAAPVPAQSYAVPAVVVPGETMV